MKRIVMIFAATAFIFGQAMGQEQLRLAILDFQAKGVPNPAAKSASDWLRTELVNAKEFLVIERSELDKAFVELNLSQSGCIDEKCAVKVGEFMSANMILVGNIERWTKDKYFINGRIIDVEKGISMFAHKETIGSLDDLPDGMALFAKNLIKRIKGEKIETIELHGEGKKVPEKGAPQEGVNYVWIDLGKMDRGHLLSLAPNDADVITEPDVKAGIDCKKLPYPYAGPGHNHMSFDIDDSFLWGGNHEVWIVMEYFDSGMAINCQYDSNGKGPVGGAFRGSADGAFAKLRLKNTDTWKFHVWHIKDGRFQNRGNGYDFRFSTHAGGSMWINRVWVFLHRPPDPFNPDDL